MRMLFYNSNCQSLFLLDDLLLIYDLLCCYDNNAAILSASLVCWVFKVLYEGRAFAAHNRTKSSFLYQHALNVIYVCKMRRLKPRNK